MPLIGEPVGPWILASVILAAVNLVIALSGNRLPAPDQTILLVGLCAAMAAGGLVAARSSRRLEISDREERARPSADQLEPGVWRTGALSYVEGMERWTAAVLQLLDHAIDAAGDEAPVRDDLVAAAADTLELYDLLGASTGGPLTLNENAMMHAVCGLWETNQPRIEALAAGVDPAWHRRWRARSVAERRLRHGTVSSDPIVLPYRP